MDPFEWYTFEEASIHEIGFTGANLKYIQNYLKIHKYKAILIPKSNLEPKIGPRQNTQISDTPQKVKYSSKSVTLRDSWEPDLVSGDEASFQKS